MAKAGVTNIENAVDTSGNLPVSNYPASDYVMVGGVQLTPKFALANVAASQTDSAVVAAVTAKKIRVLAVIALTGATATNVTFTTKPAGSGTAISALFACGSNQGFALGFNPVGWFQTNAGEGLSVTTGAGATTGIQVVYVEV